MVQARIGTQTGDEQPSHSAIDNGNPAEFEPRWLVLDDVNIDLITVTAAAAAIASTLLYGVSPTIAGGLWAAAVLPLRFFLPRPKTPEGLVLITGASSGIGAELSYIFADKGHDLILVGRNEEELDAVKENVETKFDKKAYTIAADLSLPGVPQQLYDHVTGQGFEVNVLVNGAGLGGAGHTLYQPVELTERMTVLNCVAPVQLSQLFGRDMIKRGKGWMLQISSVGGWMVSPGQNLYHASKHYVRAFSEALSVEMRAHPGIVNTQLMPGPTHTQFVTRAKAEELPMMATSASLEDPRAVAMAGYQGLKKGKRMVFSSWNAAMNATMMHLAPRSVHLTVAAIMNAPLRGLARMSPPGKDQRARGEKL